jgi:ParB family chromosome partitioning protein
MTAGVEQSIPLNLLVVADENVRKHAASGIESLADNIAAHKLLQNLVVYPHKKKFAVAAGSRRRAALLVLAKRNVIAADEPIACQVISQEQALSASLSENVEREAMHPVDELEAWEALINVGQSVDDVAANFGVTPGVVKQRLKLAGLSPRLLQAARDGEARLDQLMALTVSDDHQAQEDAFFDASHWEREPDALRATLTNEAIRSDAALVQFVGLSVYQAAGGSVQSDLFSQDDSGKDLAYCTDPSLLVQLAKTKAQPTIDAYQAKGWQWVEFVANLSQRVHQCQRAQPKRSRLSKAQSKERASLNEAVKSAQAAYETAEENGVTGEALETVGEQCDAAEAAYEAFEASVLKFDPALMAIAGCAVGLDHQGKLTVQPGLVRDEDTRAFKAYLKTLDAKSKKKGGQTASDSADTTEATDGPRVSKALRSRLTAHRTAALRFKLAMDPLAALRVTVATLAEQAGVQTPLADGLGVRGAYRDDSALSESDVQGSPVFTDWQRVQNQAVDSLNAENAIQTMEQSDLLEALAALVSGSFDAVEREERNTAAVRANAVANLVDLQMGAYWQPTAESYFQHVQIGQMLSDIGEFAPDAVSELKGLSKSALAKEAEKLVSGTNWLPALLRSSGSDLTT